MSTSEIFRDLDPKIAEPLAKVTEALKAEISSQIDGVRRDVQSLASGGSQAAGTGGGDTGRELDPLEELKLAAAGIDRSTKQATILAGLLEGAGRFCSRAAFVLTRDDGEKCWGSLGFEDAGKPLEGATVSAPNGNSAWGQVRAGAGTRALSADECAAFCAQFDASAPQVGALLPLSLGDHVAGYLYADRVGDGHLNISALQLLTFVAGQTLETLPVRKRSSTPTLTVAAAGMEAAATESAPAAEPTPPPAPPAPEPEATPEPEVIAEPEPAPSEPEPEIPDIEPIADLDPPVEPEATTETIEALSEPTLSAEDLAPLVTEPVETVDELLADPEPEVEPEPEPEPEVEPLPELSVEAEEETPSEPPASETVVMSTPPTFDQPAEPEAAAVVEAAPAEAEPTPALDPEPATEPAAPAPAADGSSTQVVPPDDVRGPGWAFTTQEVGNEAGSEALHEEARRLARLLVTEIKLYNEEQVDQGRRGGDVYRRLQEDIDRSRQIFEDRIDSQIRAENDYFKEALVRILAGGDENLLGM